AADTVSEEPMAKDNPLLGAKNCLITPHIAWAATETRQRLLNIVIENLRCFIEGKPQNVVS
ncbi:MAG: D-2-hydroxyacid dehydrogenase, partial [Treponema sp.]|nr:D-2-hydroxyacid dehydrogenase [Treponema sp.]